MEMLSVVLGAALILGIAYRWYGAFLTRWLGPDDTRPTPAHQYRDGQDFEPAGKGIVTGQHFTAIAAAGPIVGPILAGQYFGWAPALIWILLGSIFIGGVHDMASLFASIRHNACSIAEVVRREMSPLAYHVFLLFIWLSLVYVIIAFADITASSFHGLSHFALTQGDGTPVTVDLAGAGVATSALGYLLISILLGLVVRWKLMPFPTASALCVLLVGGVIWFGQAAPLTLPGLAGSLWEHKGWNMVLLAYCFAASVLPMWLLLQPRGFLGGIFLYAVLGAGVAGLLAGGIGGTLSIHFPAFRTEASPIGPMLPFLFITVACGACSGFHAIVSSGTTSKQLNRESDIRVVGYGTMLLEAMVAIIALCTLMMLVPGDGKPLNPDAVFAQGLGRFLSLFGVPFEFAIAFGLLAFSTFIFDTLDVCTRLGRYVFQEFTGLSGRRSAALATFCTLLFPALYLLAAPDNAWRQFWTLFGTSNQLLAALTLIGVSVWLRSQGKNPWPALVPALFMLAVTGIALFYNIQTFSRVVMGLADLPKNLTSGTVWLNLGIAGFLALLGLIVTIEALRVLRAPVRSAA
jgi:carbon starvation protein